MGYDNLIFTVTYDYDAGISSYTYDPADAPTKGIYPDATITVYDTNSDHYFDGEGIFNILDNVYGSHSNNYGSYVFKVGVPFVLSQAFGVVAQAGRYLWNGFPYHENNSIPIVNRYSTAGAPSSPVLAETVSREAVQLSWGAGSAGTNNSVTGYDVQYRESSDGSTWGSWTTASGSPVTATKLSVSPSSTVGNYRQYRVRTRGSAGSDYYSGWVVSTNTLRRKWNAFGAWTDPTLSVGGDLRAVHMTQMQERVAQIRSFYGMSAAAFTAITADVTLAADWADHIGEIRTAIDQITTSHAAWITASAGEPAVDVMNQLRSIIDNL